MLSSSLAVFTRAIYHFLQDTEGDLNIDDYLDTLLVIIRYSTLCFDNSDYNKYLNRSLNMINTYTGYIMMVRERDDSNVLRTNDALQLIFHHFPAIIKCDSTADNAREDFRSEIAMRVFLDRIKENKKKYVNNIKDINSLAEDVYRTISTV